MIFKTLSKVILICAIIAFSFSLRAQTLDNWVKYDQPYFKIKIAADGIYRIDYLALSGEVQQLGLSSVIPTHSMQLFHLGKEIPILIVGGDDGVFFHGDYIMFHGEKNKGELDEDLFESQEDMANPYYSLFTDTTAYFLTFDPKSNTKIGKRYTEVKTIDQNAAVIPSYLHESVKSFNNQYSRGKPYSVFGENFHYSEYKEGEGWIGPRFGFSQSIDKRIEAVPTSSVDRLSLENISAEFNIMGLSNDVLQFNDHSLEVSVGPSSTNFNAVFDTLFDGYSYIHKKLSLDMNDIGSFLTYFEFLPRKPLNVSADWIGIGYIKLTYPRKYDFTNESYFNFKAKAYNSNRNIEFVNYGKGGLTKPFVFDVENNWFYKPTVTGRDFTITLPARSKESKIVVEDEDKIIPVTVSGKYLRDLHSISDSAIDVLLNCEYNIISTKRLAGQELDEYFGYKKGEFKSSLLYVEELYDVFSYGVEHPLSIRRYCQFIADNYIGRKPTYLLLIGRGYENELHRKNPFNTKKLTVPTFGMPASDILFSNKMNGSNAGSYLATGRLAFDNKHEIRNYLDKVRKYESNTDIAIWRKEIIHLGGGKDGGQAKQILGVLNNIGEIPKKPDYGGLVTTFSKAASGIVSPYVKENTVNKINQGVNLVTFLGHGSTTFLDLDIGDTTDLSNYGRYPIYFFNGCNIGNPNLGFNSNQELFYSEQVLKAKDKGGIVFIGQSSTSELHTVSGVMQGMYRQVFNTGYGDALGINLSKALDSLYINSPTELSWLHATQTFYQGDPSIISYSPELPDYVIEDRNNKGENVFIYPENVIALSDSFAVAVIVDNAGKVAGDTCELFLIRTYPDLIRKDTFIVEVPPVFSRDTIFVWMKTKDITTEGVNYLDIEVNRKKKFNEFTYLNNKIVNKEFIMRSNGVNLIYPGKFEIVRGDTAKLVVNAMNLTENPQDFVFQIDTSHDFTSPFIKSSGHIQTGPLSIVTFPLLNEDSVVYYWRCKLGTDLGNGGYFKQRSFTNIKNNPTGGWSQAHFPEFFLTSKDKVDGLRVDTLNRRTAFGELEKGIWVDADRNNTSFKGVKLGGGFSSKDINAGVCFDGLVAMLFNKNTLELEYHPTMDPKDLCPNGDSYNGSERQIYYNFQTQYVQGWNLFDSFIKGIPEGTHVAIFSRKTTHIDGIYNGWPQYMLDALNSIGSKAMDNIDVNDPNFDADLYQFVCVGQKGIKPGQATEEVTYGGYASVEARILGQRSDGSILSEPIGPVGEWFSAYFNFDKKSEFDSFNLHILAVRPNKQDTVILKNLKSTNIDLTSIDAKKFPILRLQADFKDINDRTQPQLINWRVTSSSVPEGLINIARGYEDFNGVDTLLEGEVFNSRFAFENISGYAFDSVLVVSRFEEKLTRKILWTDTSRIKPLRPFEWDFYAKDIETKGLKGAYTYTVSFNPGPEQTELSLVNNSQQENFYVRVDEVNPLLDVTFDGKHIINGDLVSAQPRILITSKDENKVLLQDDTSKFILYLKSPGSSDFVELNIDGNELLYFPATNESNMALAEYMPSKLADGEYTLRVQTCDKTGNLAGPQPYEISFKVINETSISNFYPYPNPFTSQTRFIFTLTGSEIPDYINIKIMTISQKVIKEINKEDLGNITIGNNISEYSWNATDEFGDRLANGVYLYKVTVRHNGKEVKGFSTAGDGSFKKNIGKLYIMR